ncbi:unnamed protein product [Didymodactylos carnosus]|uniref:Endoplasmic reticulum-Golgi intermediate compartment protein 1 n=1 Tax=Didymodactylos carnosus TaxID=1234261 RepID=A0A8S2E5R5_9BILA|nr:unnamed protein product [Didymodactylos carnosus]CAF3917556.1 unnamed protein product [Didymodactylos carnosus]
MNTSNLIQYSVCEVNKMQFDIRRFDIYRKVPKDLTQPTNTGAAISIFCVTFISTLLLIELYYFINLGIDIQDDLGRHEVGLLDHIVKTPENDGQGCRIVASFRITKVPGNFHISTHRASPQPDHSDMKHVIHELNFGDSIKGFRRIPNRKAFHPLRRYNNTLRPSHVSHDYLLKIVPTIYENLAGTRRRPYQFTFVYREHNPTHAHGVNVLPVIWFRCDTIPITVKYTERRPKLYTFITSICAVVGGTFTVASILDSLILSASALLKKIELGKMT